MKKQKITVKEEKFDLNKIILSDDYNNVKEKLRKEIIEDIHNNKLNFTNKLLTNTNKKDNFLMHKKVKILIENEIYEMTYGNFLTVLIMVKPFNVTKTKFTKEFLFDPTNVKGYNNYFTKLLETFNYSDKVKKAIKDIISEMVIISGDINFAYGITISLKSMIDLENNIPELRDIIHYKIPENKNYEINDLEKQLKDILKRLIDLLKNTDSIFKYLLRSESGINVKQFGQIFTIVGFKPDLFGNIISYPINTNFARGLDLKSYYINATGARKALNFLWGHYVVIYNENFFNCWNSLRDYFIVLKY